MVSLVSFEEIIDFFNAITSEAYFTEILFIVSFYSFLVNAFINLWNIVRVCASERNEQNLSYMACILHIICKVYFKNFNFEFQSHYISRTQNEA